MKLETTAAVLEWAQESSEIVDQGHGYLTASSLVFTPDTKTAAYLAYCVRVTEAAQKQAMYETARWGDDRWAEMLRKAEAAKGETK